MRKVNLNVYTIDELKNQFPKTYKKVIEKEQNNIQSDEWWKFVHEDLCGQLKHMGFELGKDGFGFDLYKNEVQFDGMLSYKPLSEYLCTDFQTFHQKLNDIQGKYKNSLVVSLKENEKYCYKNISRNINSYFDYSFESDDGEYNEKTELSKDDCSNLISIISDIANDLLDTLQKDLASKLTEESIVENFKTQGLEFFADGSIYIN